MTDRVQMETGVTGPDAPVEEVHDSAEEVSERPEWLPEKFSTPEDMAHAYSELESKMGAQSSESDADEDAPYGAVSSESLEPYTSEFMESGDLSDESVAKIESDLGIPQDIVRAYVEGQKAVIEQSKMTVFNEVGGEDQYGAMIEWAKENLSEEEIGTYDQAMDSGDMNAALMAARGLAARFAQDSGTSPNLVKGSASSAKGGSPFRSWNQVSEAMRDPRYQRDPAFRNEVQERLAISKL